MKIFLLIYEGITAIVLGGGAVACVWVSICRAVKFIKGAPKSAP